MLKLLFFVFYEVISLIKCLVTHLYTDRVLPEIKVGCLWLAMENKFDIPALEVAAF